MQEVSEVEYLGDMITSDGKNRKNLKKRISRGMGAVTNISCILREVSFGKHYVQIALLLRETLFLSTLLFNVEVWYNITKSEIKELENLDVLLLRKILNAPVTTPIESFYLELGLLPISVIIKMKRDYKTVFE